MSEHDLTTNEIWKPVSVCPVYSVSDHGRVGRRGGRRCDHAWKIRKPIASRGGYLRVQLNLGSTNEKRYFNVHRLVLEAFVGPCPDGMECRHLDGNPANNRLGNLEWATHFDNMQDREIHGTLPRGTKGGQAKASDEIVREIRKLKALGVAKLQLAQQFGLAYSTIKKICSRKTWKHI